MLTGGIISKPTQIIIYCQHCGAENRLWSDYTSDNTSGIIYCIRCGHEIG